MQEYQTMLFEGLGRYKHAAAHLELMAGMYNNDVMVNSFFRVMILLMMM